MAPQDSFLRSLSGLLPAGTVPTTWVELLHNATSAEEVLAGEPIKFNTGERDVHSLWNVRGSKWARHDVTLVLN